MGANTVRKTLAGLALIVGLVAACSGSAATAVPQSGGSPAPTQAAPTQAAPTQAAPTPGAPTQAAATATPAPTSAAPGTLDACSLLTAADAQAALGEPVDPGVPPEAGAHSCIFAGHPTVGLDLNSVEISLTDVAAFDPSKKSIPGLTITPVSGIGDAAYYVSMGAGYEVLNVRKGQVTFTVSVLLKGASDAELQTAEQTLAAAALGRI
jgi:hypothetical protein